MCEKILKQKIKNSGRKMIKIKPSDLPSELKKGSMYRTLMENGDEEFEIEEKYVVKEFVVKDIISFKTTLDIARYWDLYKLPIELYVYSFLHNEDVIKYINTLDDIAYKCVKEDFLYNIGLTKYKYDVIAYVKSIYENMDDNMKIMLDELEKTVYFSAKAEITHEEKDFLVEIDQYNEIFKNPCICININLHTDGYILENPFVRIFKINNKGTLFSLMKMEVYHRFAECIKESINWEFYVNNEFLSVHNGKIEVFNTIILITKYNRDNLSYQFKNLHTFFEDTVDSYFPIEFVLDHVKISENISDYDETLHVKGLLRPVVISVNEECDEVCEECDDECEEDECEGCDDECEECEECDDECDDECEECEECDDECEDEDEGEDDNMTTFTIFERLQFNQLFFDICKNELKKLR
jgi:hypothetical protein